MQYLAQYFDVTTDDVLERIVWSAIPLRKPGAAAGDSLDRMPGLDKDLILPLTSNMQSTSLDMDGTMNYEITSPNRHQSDRNKMAASPSGSSLSLNAIDKQKRLSYVERFIQSRPDLYGPLWISVTLIFAVAISANCSSYLEYTHRLEAATNASNMELHGESKQDEDWHYSMYEMNTMASLIMFYVTLLPAFLWCIFWFRGCSKYYTITETICAYGYSLSIFVPLAVALIVQASLFRYVVAASTSALSGLTLAMSFLPIARSDPSSKMGSSLAISLMVICAHMCLAYVLHRITLTA